MRWGEPETKSEADFGANSATEFVTISAPEIALAPTVSIAKVAP